MASRVEENWRYLYRLSCSILCSGDKRRTWSWKPAPGGMRSTKLSSLGIFLLLLHSAQASEDDVTHEASGSAGAFLDMASSTPFLMTEKNPFSVVKLNSTDSSKGNREQPAFSSVLSLLASTAQRFTKLNPSKVTPESHIISTNNTHGWLSNRSLVSSFTPPLSSELVSNLSVVSESHWISQLMSPVGTSRAAEPHWKSYDSIKHPPEQRNTVAPNRPSLTAVDTQWEQPEVMTLTVSQPTVFISNTVATTSTPSSTTTELTIQYQHTHSTSAKRNTKTFIAIKNSTTLQESLRTKPRILLSSTLQNTKTSTSRSTLGPPRAAVTEAPLPRCNITDRIWIKTVLSVQLRRSRLDSILKQNLPRGLTNALKKALNDSMVQAKVGSISSVPNVTVGYYVTRGRMVYTSSVVLDALTVYGIERLMADIHQFVPLVQAILVPAARWRPSPAISLMLKTVLRFVGPEDDLRSCRFTQMMEQRLENAFAEAEAIVLNSYSSLTVQILSVSQSTGSPAVSLIYVVQNGSATLNGTAASNLLSRLTAELLGYFLFYPPLITAEPLEYHNLNTSVETRPFWVITVIQDVENSSLERQYQSFARLMEERLAELLMVAHQQGVRFKRATTVGSYTVQMVSIRHVLGPKKTAELTYYVQQNGTPLLGTATAKLLNTVDSQTMALTLGYFVQLQAEAVVKNPPNNLWIMAAVLAPIGVVTLIIVIIITTVLCHKNKSNFKSDSISSFNPRVKTAYWRDAGYYPQPVQGFDYAKQHLGQQGGDEETLPVTKETMVLPHPIRDAPRSLDKVIRQDGSASKKSLTSEIRKSRLPSEDGSVTSSKSVKEVSGKGLIVQKATAQQNLRKEEIRKSNDHYDSSSGSLHLISIKPITALPTYSHPASSDRSQDSAILNGEVNLALKQKSDIEHYRNKLRLKAKRKGYYDFPSAEGRSSTKDLSQRHNSIQNRPPHPRSRAAEQEDDRGSTYVKHHRRSLQMQRPSLHSGQSLNSPSPGGTEMDLLVMRERLRKGIRNSGYDTEPEIIAETDVDCLANRHYYGCGRQLKGQSETSTLSSQPSINEVRQQMHLLLEEAFSLASAGHSSSSRHHQRSSLGPYGLGPVAPYSEVVTSAPGTTCRGKGGLQWVPAYRPDPYQYSLAKQAFRFTQLPDMALGSPPPPIPPRTGPLPEPSMRRSSSDLGPKRHCSELSAQSKPDSATYMPDSRAPLPPVTTAPIPNLSGNPMTAVYAIPSTRPGYTGYFISTPPSSYHSPSWMSYPPEPEDVPSQWAESMPLPGYAEAFPHPHYPQGSPLLWHHSRSVSTQDGPDHPPSLSAAASQQSLAESRDPVSPDTTLSSLSTSALVKAIRDEVAKLAKKQADMSEFQV